MIDAYNGGTKIGLSSITNIKAMKSRSSQFQRIVCPEIASVDVALLEQLFAQVSELAFFIKDRDGRYIAVNQSLLTRHGLKSRSQIIGKRPQDFCPGDFGRFPTEQDANVLRTGKPLIDLLEMQWQLPNEPVWCLTTKLPIRNPTGDVIGLIGFSRDVRAQLESSDIPNDFARAVAEFETQLSPEVTPAWLAKRSALSSSRLSRLTKRIYNLTPSQFITKSRIAAASRILLDTDDAIADVAYAAGFYDHSAFTRAFRTATGVTPTEFREAYRS